jgi:hypothetical protein
MGVLGKSGFLLVRWVPPSSLPQITLAATPSGMYPIGVLDQPFSGGARIDPGAFELVLNRFETSKLSDL